MIRQFLSWAGFFKKKQEIISLPCIVRYNLDGEPKSYELQKNDKIIAITERPSTPYVVGKLYSKDDDKFIITDQDGKLVAIYGNIIKYHNKVESKLSSMNLEQIKSYITNHSYGRV